MSMSKQDLRLTADTRITEQYLIDQRGIRQDTHAARMERYATIDAIARGDWSVVFPDESTRAGKPTVMNQVQVELDDIARLVSETQPSLRIPPRGDSKTAETAAAVKEAIATGYWSYNRAERLVPLTAMDLAGCGMSVWLCYTRGGFDYPAVMRLDPRTCYPTILNGELTDLVTILKLKGRQLKALRDIEIGKPNDDVEIIGFWDNEISAELAYSPTNKAGEWIEPPVQHNLEMIPVAWAQLDTFDGSIRGMFDQIGGIINIKNRIANLILDNADQMVYAPTVDWEIENIGEFGPGAHLHKNVAEATLERLEPASVSPQLFGLLQWLEGEARAGGGYPATRQGEVPQSIASASFVTSTMGQLTSTVRNIQRLISMQREQANRIMFAIDERKLDNDKPLCRTVGGKKSYTPSKEIKGDYENQVVYGAGAGLDKANQYVLALQLKGAGLVSDETIMGELSEVTDPIGERDRIVREQMESALLQKFAAEAPLDMTMKAVALMGEGKSLLEVATALIPQAEQQAAQAQAAASGQAPQGPLSPQDVQAQATSLEKGGVPGQAPAQSGQGAPSDLKLVPDVSNVNLVGR